MKKYIFAAFAASFALAGVAHAQNAVEGIAESTDPSKAAAVEAHARELQSNQSDSSSQMSSKHHRGKMEKSHGRHHSMSSGSSSSSHRAGQATTGENPSTNESAGSSK